MELQPFSVGWAALAILTSLLVKAGVVPMFSLFYVPGSLFKGNFFQLLNPFFFGDLKGSLFRCLSILMFLPHLEKIYTKRGVFLFLFIFCIFACSFFCALFRSFLIAPALFQCFMYILGRLSPHMQVNYIMFPVPIRYSPVVSLIMTTLLDDQPNWKSIIIGVLAGHCVFYLLFILPCYLNRSIVKTPQLLIILCDYLENKWNNYQAENQEHNQRGPVGRHI